jgi:hypothetical protein
VRRVWSVARSRLERVVGARHGEPAVGHKDDTRSGPDGLAAEAGSRLRDQSRGRASVAVTTKSL